MTSLELAKCLSLVDDAYISEAQDIRPRRRQAVHRRALLIAAAVAAALLLAGCAIIYALRLQNMVIKEEPMHQEAWQGPEGETIPSTEYVLSYLSLQGYGDSPNQKALAEWRAFTDSYDQDGTLLDANNFNESGVAENYYITYSCYTQEMVDKLEEILAKYHLEALGASILVQRWEAQMQFEALQIHGLCLDDSQADYQGGYLYPDGSFHSEFYLTPAGQEELLISLTYANTRYLNPVVRCVTDIQQWQQWDYTSASGAQVLLAAYRESGIIVCDCGDAFLSLSFNLYGADPDTQAGTVSQALLEQVADTIDFTIRPQGFDPAEVEAMRVNYPKPEELPYGAAEGSWADRVAYHQTMPHQEEMAYCLADVDCDGEEELLIARNGVIRRAYKQGDGYTLDPFFFGIWHMDRIVSVDYGVEDGIPNANSIRFYEGGKAVYEFQRQDCTEYVISSTGSGKRERIVLIEREGDPTTYFIYTYDWDYWCEEDTGDYKESPISQEEYEAYFPATPELEFVWIPLSDYPMD